MSEHIVFLDRSTLKARVRRPAFEHTWDEYETTPPARVVERLEHATIAITNKVPLRSDVLAQLPRLRMIGVAATGHDVIDIPACRERGIVVSNIRNYAVHTVPEHVFALILALRRNILAYRRDVERGRWQEVDQFCFFDHAIRDLHGSTLGIFGEGVLGQGTARIGQAFGMRVLFAEHAGAKPKGVQLTPVDRVLAESDIISLHCPLTADSRNMIGMAQLRRMKRDAILINTARGGLVNETDLATALKEGIIGGAGFDVLTKEPPKDGNPLLELRMPNFILTPHVAWASDGAMQALADQLIDNVEAFARGSPVNTVT